MSLVLHKQQDKLALDAALVDFVSEKLTAAIQEKGRATLVVSGGSTPVNFFQQLSQAKLPWKNVSITLADERCVPATDVQSNAKLVQENLLQDRAKEANFVPLYLEDETIDDCEDRLERSFFSEPFDVVILGMGGDAHTASIFPEAKERDQALDMTVEKFVLKTDPVTVTPERITQTRKSLLNSHHLLLHFTGAAKWEVFAKAQEKMQLELPISYFIHQEVTSLQVFYTS